jgi:hypothetical protein
MWVIARACHSSFLTLVLIAPAIAVMAYLSSGFPFPGHMENVFIFAFIQFSRFMGAENCSHTLKGKKALNAEKFF